MNAYSCGNGVYCFMVNDSFSDKIHGRNKGKKKKREKRERKQKDQNTHIYTHARTALGGVSALAVAVHQAVQGVARVQVSVRHHDLGERGRRKRRRKNEEEGSRRKKEDGKGGGAVQHECSPVQCSTEWRCGRLGR